MILVFVVQPLGLFFVFHQIDGSTLSTINFKPRFFDLGGVFVIEGEDSTTDWHITNTAYRLLPNRTTMGFHHIGLFESIAAVGDGVTILKPCLLKTRRFRLLYLSHHLTIWPFFGA